jgi:hypothetical protein
LTTSMMTPPLSIWASPFFVVPVDFSIKIIPPKKPRSDTRVRSKPRVVSAM